MKKFVGKFRSTVISIAFLMAMDVQAATIVCSGTVDVLSYHASNTSGVLIVRLSSMNQAVAFCDPESTWSAPGSGYSVSPGACKALYATFLAAKLSGQTINSMYFDGDAAPASCSTWGSWPSANVRYYVF